MRGSPGWKQPNTELCRGGVPSQADRHALEILEDRAQGNFYKFDFVVHEVCLLCGKLDHFPIPISCGKHKLAVIFLPTNDGKCRHSLF